LLKPVGLASSRILCAVTLREVIMKQGLLQEAHTWNLFEKCGFCGDAQLQALKHSWTASYPLPSLTRIPVLILLIWELVQPDAFSLLTNDKVRILTIVILFFFNFVHMTVPLSSRGFFHSESLHRALETGIALQAPVFSRVHREQSLSFCWGIIVVTINMLFSPRTLILLLAWALPIPFPHGCYVRFIPQVSDALVQKMIQKVQDRRTPKSNFHDEFWTRFLNEMLDFTDILFGLWSDAKLWVVPYLAVSFLLTICFSLIAFASVPEHPLISFIAAMGGFGVGMRVLMQISSMAEVTYRCMRTDQYGLHGTILAAARDIAEISQKDILAHHAILHTFTVRTVGAHLWGIMMDRSKLIAVALSLAASFYHLFTIALRSLTAPD